MKTMEKIKFRKAAQTVACIDLMVSCAGAFVILLVIFTIVYPVWYADLDTSTRAGVWMTILNGMYYLKDKKLSEQWIHISVGVLLFFTFLGVVAGIALLWSTDPKTTRGRSLNLAWFWVHCNVPVFFIYFSAGFIFNWCFLIASLRPIYMIFVWMYIRGLRQSKPRNYADVTDAIAVPNSPEDGPHTELIYTKLETATERACYDNGEYDLYSGIKKKINSVSRKKFAVTEMISDDQHWSVCKEPEKGINI